MRSGHVVDSQSRSTQIEHFLKQQRDARTVAAFSEGKAKNDALFEKDAGFDTTDMAQQMGRPLSRQEIIARLSRMNKNLLFEQSTRYPTMGAVYVVDGHSNMDDPDPQYRGRRHIVGMEWSISPEFTSKKIERDHRGEPRMTGQVRGWRTILQRLIKERLITLEQAEKAFAISKGRDSQKWHEVLS